jgi:peptidyl-prolyl cis-trans isomerase A (cyclophilin A)
MHRFTTRSRFILPFLAAAAALCAMAGHAVAGEALMDPAALNEKAPDVFRAKFETSKGDVIVEVHRAWDPTGADRFYNLVKNAYFDGCRFFRVVPGFIVQFGMHGDPEIGGVWRTAYMKDEPVEVGNTRGTLVYAKPASPADRRTTQLFINLGDNSRSLDRQGFSAFGKVIEGIELVDAITAEYGQRPNQAMIAKEGNAYLQREFPNLDFIKKATLME